MDEILIVDSALISLWVYPARRMIHHRMKLYCYGDELRQALMTGADALEQHRVTKWLSDDRINGALVPDDVAWLNQHWRPRVVAAGWKHWAIVQPAKLLGQSTLQRVVQNYGTDGINTRMFADPDEAMRWLLAQ